MPDVGDPVTLTLTVEPSDPTTTATVQVTSPTGVVTGPGTTPNGDRSIWTAPLTLTAAGAWTATWTVTGMGAGVQHQTVYAIAPPSGTAYATLTDLAAWLGAEPPDGSLQRLIRASTTIDGLLVGAVYPVDTNGLPTQPAQITAFRDATCAQAQWLVELGDITGTGINTWWDPLSTESTSTSERAGVASYGSRRDWRSQQQPLVAPMAVTILRQAGLLPLNAITYG